MQCICCHLHCAVGIASDSQSLQKQSTALPVMNQSHSKGVLWLQLFNMCSGPPQFIIHEFIIHETSYESSRKFGAKKDVVELQPHWSHLTFMVKKVFSSQQTVSYLLYPKMSAFSSMTYAICLWIKQRNHESERSGLHVSLHFSIRNGRYKAFLQKLLIFGPLLIKRLPKLLLIQTVNLIYQQYTDRKASLPQLS